MKKQELAYLVEWAYQNGVMAAHKEAARKEELERAFRQGQMAEAKRNNDNLRLLDLQSGLAKGKLK